MLDPHICIKIYQKKFDVTNFDDFALTKKVGKSLTRTKFNYESLMW